MSTRSARKGTARPRRAPSSLATTAAGIPWSPLSPVFIGLCAVVLAVPLALAPSATGPYDDAKAWALPILVGATVLAWTVVALRRRGDVPSAPDRGARLVGWIVIAYVSWLAITTALSIAPGLSLLGNFGRGMGLVTAASVVTLFFLVSAECRTLPAIRGLVDAALLGSAGVCALALAQALGWNPLPRTWDPATARLEVRSTLGQHIFLGSYLVILLPLGVARLWSLRRARVAREEPSAPSSSVPALVLAAAWVAGTIAIAWIASRWSAGWWALAPWGIVGALAWSWAGESVARGGRRMLSIGLGMLVGAQAIALIVSGARGPLLGLVLGLALAGVLLFASRRSWKPLILAGTAVAVIVVGLVLVNVPSSPLAPLGNLQMVRRLGELGRTSHGSTTWFRLEVWKALAVGWGRQIEGRDLVPDTSPLFRSVVGYGLETQLLTFEQLVVPSLGALPTGGRGWRAQYLVDRAHNVVLDHLATGGLVGAALWLTLIASLVVVGLSRVRLDGSEEAALRVGGLVAVLAHVFELQVGIATAAPLALFWIVAGMFALPTQARASSSPRGPVRRSRRIVAPAVAAVALVMVVWGTTRWLVGSIAYADGTRHELAGQTRAAYEDFQRSRALVPWLPLTAVATAYTALRLAGTEADAASRLALLRAGESALSESRRYAMPDAGAWQLAAQLALGEARAGDKGKLTTSVAAFELATRLRPQDPQLWAQAGLARLEGGDPVRARQAAERALAVSRTDWLPWAVLARSARELGDADESRRAADMARRLAPPEAQRVLQSML